jgi:hypothetical protein
VLGCRTLTKFENCLNCNLADESTKRVSRPKGAGRWKGQPLFQAGFRAGLGERFGDMPAVPRAARLASLFDAQPYADLPDEVLQAVLAKTAEVADAVRGLFSRVDERRDAMRDALLADARVRRLADLPALDTLPSVAAVDGGAAIEKSIGADTALAVAVGIEGLTDAPLPHWPGVQYAAWQKTLPHEGDDTARACRGRDERAGVVRRPVRPARRGFARRRASDAGDRAELDAGRFPRNASP